jgi:uncharacterized repeat protein (TIGR03803 family)
MLCNNRSGTLSAALLVIITVILVLAPGAWAASQFKTLHKFTGGADGGTPSAGLVSDSAGNLYGTTTNGGAGFGVVFKLAPSLDGSWTESVLHSFTSGGKDGELPFAGLILDQGNLYGTTGGGGDNNTGVVFQLMQNLDGSWTENVLYAFTGSPDGEVPTAPLIFDSSGNLYGTTSKGGVYGSGTVFKLTPHSGGAWTENVLYDFTGGDLGGTPNAGVIFDAKGNLYGTTQFAGANNVGVVFKLKPSSRGIWAISVLHSFTGGKDGGLPLGTLVMDPAGNLYGTTERGGLYEYGTVFKLTPNSAERFTESVLHSFTGGKDGGLPFAGLIFDQGNLYGTTLEGGRLRFCGGSGCGVVFKLAPNSKGGWNEAVLHAFFDDPGAFPLAGVIFGAAGNLYGTTSGRTAAGSVFEITP